VFKPGEAATREIKEDKVIEKKGVPVLPP